jgi:hypothetical protein
MATLRVGESVGVEHGGESKLHDPVEAGQHGQISFYWQAGQSGVLLHAQEIRRQSGLSLF